MREFIKAHPELPWLEMRGMRNKMIHNYFDVELAVVWNMVKKDLPQLKQQIDGLLIGYRRSHEKEQGQDKLLLMEAPYSS